MKIIIGLLTIVLLITTGFADNAYAHTMNLGLLDIRETTKNDFEVHFNYSGAAANPLGASVAVPEHCKALTPTQLRIEGKSQQLFWRMTCENGLENKRFRFKDIENGVAVMIRFTPLDGTTHETQLPRSEHAWTFKRTEEKPSNAGFFSYIPLGIEHILKGSDHVCFVIAIVVLLAKQRKLLRTVTAFTVGHSITLALSSLGAVSLPSSPVEALIALSIVLMAREITQQPQQTVSLTRAFPEWIAVIFGLLHGLGFAGVLADIGLPKDAIFSSLLGFNIGIELGQLFIITLTLPMLAWLGRWWVRRHNDIVAYTLGTLASFWMFERLLLL